MASMVTTAFGFSIFTLLATLTLIDAGLDFAPIQWLGLIATVLSDLTGGIWLGMVTDRG